MVFEAVAGLKEPYGSTNASIASYIEVRWHLLVDWTSRLFTPYSSRVSMVFLCPAGRTLVEVCEEFLYFGIDL